MSQTHACPICSAPVYHFERYPRQVCGDCYSRACDAGGRPLLFGNASISGGFVAVYADTGENYGKHQCFIDGIECRADEFRFGGIVIEAVDKQATEESSNNL
jgi:hypothetical protein